VARALEEYWDIEELKVKSNRIDCKNCQTFKLTFKLIQIDIAVRQTFPMSREFSDTKTAKSQLYNSLSVQLLSHFANFFISFIC
jgi:hypothetical protein